MVLNLDEAAVARHLNYEKLIPVMERALAEFSAGKVQQPVREIIAVEEGKRYFGIMPAAMTGAMGAKLVAFYPGNEGTAHHTHYATITLFDPATGVPLAFMDGRLITEMRTAAVSAAVTKHAAMPNSKVLTLVGSGVQAKSHLEALRHVGDFSAVRVWSRTPENAKAFAEVHHAKAMALEEAVRGADVVVIATFAQEPLLKGAWLKPGAHINAMGAPRATWREMDDDVMSNVVIVDSRAAAMKESGDVILSRCAVYAEAGEIFGGQKKINRSATTVFKSLGLAVEDIAAARLVYDAVR
jgi:thiomorpholine-carboxylate dehydrogenase